MVLYDIRLLNGKVLTNILLWESIEILGKIINVKEGRVELSKRVKASSTKDVVDALNEAIDRREEGLVVKDPDSAYRPAARAGGGWIKVKPEYQNHDGPAGPGGDRGVLWQGTRRGEGVPLIIGGGRQVLWQGDVLVIGQGGVWVLSL